MSEPIVAQDVTKSFARDGDRVEVLKGVSRTIYYAQRNRIAWTSVGLNEKATGELEASVKRDLAS